MKSLIDDENYLIEEEEEEEEEIPEPEDAKGTVPEEGEEDPEKPEEKEDDDKGDEEEQPEDFDPFDEEQKKDPEKKPEEEEDDVLDDDKKLIQSEVKKAISPFVEQNQNQIIDNKVTTFLSSQEGQLFKPFEEKIRNVAKNPKAQGWKLEAVIAAAVGHKTLLKIGSKLNKDAEEEAGNTRTAGTASRKEGSVHGIPDVSKMNDAEVEKLARDVETGRFKKA